MPGENGRFSAAVVAAEVVTVAVPLPADPNAVEETEHLGVSAVEFVGLPALRVQELRVTFAE
jgi:hypothetical protein